MTIHNDTTTETGRTRIADRINHKLSCILPYKLEDGTEVYNCRGLFIRIDGETVPLAKACLMFLLGIKCGKNTIPAVDINGKYYGNHICVMDDSLNIAVHRTNSKLV